ncbi:MAG: hypothetical protein AUH72_13955 [Acidobacteria bacterium 13_1_40CM_4_65_8]|nr:MAG: hypothetical protein AUH72_13955 [Acidobacteria bacterium 13_1_40CM_4_65_8]
MRAELALVAMLVATPCVRSAGLSSLRSPPTPASYGQARRSAGGAEAARPRGDPESVALQAPATGSIHGIIVDTRGGTPVQRVSVRLQASGRTVITDDQGRFVFDEVPAGAQELYVSAVDFILVKRTVTVGAGSAVDVTIALTEGTGTYTETVNVNAGTLAPRREPAVPSEQTLGSRELQQLRGLVTNDPFRAVQVLPAVAASDDLRSEFAIRGAGIRQMNFTFEGIATPFLLHTVQQVHDSGSVAMVNGDVLEEISLLNGSYPQRHGNRTGAEIDFRMREGSRERVQSHLSVSAIDASGVVEGPIGPTDDAKRGSWLFAARKSYLNLVVDRIYRDQNISFGFVDAQSKVVYDVTPRHQLQLALTAGRSRMERNTDQLGAGNLRDADNQAALAVATWRYLPSARFTIAERVAIAQNRFDNSSRDGAELDAGDGHEALARTDASFAPAGWLTIDSGVEARWSNGTGREQRLAAGRFQSRENYNGSSIASSAFVQARFARGGGVSVTPGVRVDRQSLTDRVDVSPWVQAMWPLSRAVTLRAGGGIYRQQAGFAELLGVRGSRDLRPERAYHGDAGLEGRLGAYARWQMTVYDREDRDLLRLPDVETRVVDRALVFGSITSRWVNALDGHARGVEWLVQRQNVNGFSGWASYALAYAQYQDRRTGESFWGDYDQRHTINLYGTYRVTDRTSVGARFRAGSNFPITGYWAEQGGAYFVGTDRNTLRVPTYARLDVRANRTFTWERKRLTLFAEGINLLNRPNVRFSLPAVNRRTFEATGLLDTMVPLIPSVGILLEF